MEKDYGAFYTIKYPIKRVEVKTVNLMAGVKNATVDNVIMGKLPSRIVIGLTAHSWISGSYHESCFNFKNFGVQSLSVLVNGNVIDQPFEAEYSTETEEICQCTMNYFRFCFDVDAYNELWNGISLKQYGSNLTLYAVDLTADRDSGSCCSLNPTQYGSISLKILLTQASLTPITTVVYYETDAVI